MTRISRSELSLIIRDYIDWIVKDNIESEYAAAGLTSIDLHEFVETAVDFLHDDIDVFAKTDPASKGEQRLIARSYNSFFAVASYRIAHEIHIRGIQEQEYLGVPSNLVTLARKISEHAKSKTGAELHPGATIGRRFILDHGYNTVIGETCVIGDDCTLLNNVVLGASGVKGNENDKLLGYRHPQLGNSVEVGGNVSVFGPVSIGDDVKIGAGCQIIRSLDAGSRVSRIAMMQLERPRALQGRKPIVHGLIPNGPGKLDVYGTDLLPCVIEWAPGDHLTARLSTAEVTVEVISSAEENYDKLSVILSSKGITRNDLFEELCQLSLGFGDDDRGRIMLRGLAVQQALRTAGSSE